MFMNTYVGVVQNYSLCVVSFLLAMK